MKDNYVDSQIDELPIVVAVGFFDGVHLGHQFLIEQVKAEAASSHYESAVITFTEHPKKVLGASFSPYLLTPLTEKIQLLKQTGLDYCIPLAFSKELSGYSAFRFMDEILRRRYNAKTLIVGYDHRFGYNRTESFEQYVEYGKKLGIKVIQAKEYIEDYVSSSKIRLLLAEGEIEKANALLGYKYKLQGVVVDGLKLARKLGYPTANIQLANRDLDKMLPLLGVYAVWVWLDDVKYHGMLYIGKRPTMLNNGGVTIEVNILDFHQEIYGKDITVELLKFVREDIKFSNAEKIKAQIDADLLRIQKFFAEIKL